MVDVKSKITIKTVAQDAGVSVSAVSKVLRNAYGVSEALRENVHESIERLGYRPSSAARGMRGQTYTVGILLVGLENPFLNKLILGINSVLSEAGYKTMIGVGRAETHIETSLIESMIDFKMDGLILIGPRLESDTLARFGRQVPIVTIAHHEPDAKWIDTGNADDRMGARLAVQAMIERGHRDIAMLSLPKRGERTTDVWVEREAGYCEAMQQAGLGHKIKISRISERMQDTDDEILNVLKSPNRSSAYFCWSDMHAVPLLNAAGSDGLDVPGDIAIVGFDNSPPAQMPAISLSSVRQSAFALGETAARCVLSRLSGRTEAEHYLLPPELVVRNSI